MSDALDNISQLIQTRLVDRTNSIGRINDDAFSRVTGSELNDSSNRQSDVTTPPLQDDFFAFVQEQQDYEDFLNDQLLQEDILRQQEALAIYQDQVDQRTDDLREIGNDIDVRG